MERGAGGNSASPPRATGGMCDRLLTFLANGLSVNRQKSITEGTRKGGSGGYHQLEAEDEFAIRIERAEFEFSDHGDEGHGRAMTVLEDTSTVAATASDEQQQKRAAADAAADRPVAAAAVEETKIRKTVTIKEDRPEDAAAAAAGNKGAPALERKKSLFKKRQASTSSSAGAGEEQGGRAPRRSGLRPRMPAVLRVPSNINQKSSAFIEERRKSFGSSGKTAPADM